MKAIKTSIFKATLGKFVNIISQYILYPVFLCHKRAIIMFLKIKAIQSQLT